MISEATSEQEQSVADNNDKKRKRSRTGCLVCRSDRKGCNEARPVCERCARLNYACAYPEPASDRHAKAARRLSNRKKVELDSKNITVTPVPVPSAAEPTIEPQWPTPAAQLPFVANELDTVELFRLLDDLPNSQPMSNFWNQDLLYGLAFDNLALPEADSLLALTGQQPTRSNFDALSSTPARVAVPRQQLEAVRKKLPRKVYATIDKMVRSQGDDVEPVLPIAYLVNISMWLGPSAIEDLVTHAKQVYPDGSALRNVVRTLDEATSHLLTCSPANTIKELITVEEILEMSNISIETKMHAATDLGFRQLFVHGSSGWYSHLKKVEGFLCRHLKLDQSLNLGVLGKTEYFGFANWAWADICRSVALGRPTTFSYIFQPLQGQKYNATEFTNGGLDRINCIISDISTFRWLLERDHSSRPERNTVSDVYKPKANAILHDLRLYTPSTIADDMDADTDSIELVAAFAAQEVWRQAALIHFYQSIYRSTADFPPLQACLQQILQLAKIVDITGPFRLEAILAVPSFLAATVAISESDRQACRARMDGISGITTAVAHKQNKAFIEELWLRRDKNGLSVDWHDWASESVGPAFL